MNPIYARVWRAKWSPGTTPASMNTAQLKKLDDEPLGQVCVDKDEPYWIKVNGEWTNPLSMTLSQIILEKIPQSAYESDLEFGLWAELPLTYRPVRSWYKKNRVNIGAINFVMACLTFFLSASIFIMADYTKSISLDGWFLGFVILCLFHATGTFVASIIPGLPYTLER